MRYQSFIFIFKFLVNVENSKSFVGSQFQDEKKPYVLEIMIFFLVLGPN